MAKLQLTSEIVDNETKVWLAWDGIESTSSDDIIKFIDNISPDDKEIDIRINCCGGNVWEGWRIYDALRRSGKEISATVEGLCASMATVILLAAPKERRYAYQNASFCIHNPAACWLDVDYYNRLTADNIDAMADKMKLQAKSLRDQQQKILDVYVERTGSDAETLQSLMNDDIVVTIAKAKELGFITDTLAYNTASIKKLFKNYQPMNKDKVEVGKTWLDRLIAKAGFKSMDSVKFNDQTFTAADGTSFVVEREDSSYAVGDTASPDGKFIMEDGTTVEIANGAISAIVAPVAEIKDPVTGEVITEEEAQQKLNDYQAKVEDLEKKLEEKNNAANDALNEKKALEDKVAELNTSIETANKEVENLKAAQVTDEQKAMLDTIASAGGKAWFDAMCDKQSNGQPQVPQAGFNNPDAKIGSAFIADVSKANKRFRVQ